MTTRRMGLLMIAVLWAGCGGEGGFVENPSPTSGGKADTGWVGDDSFEVKAIFQGKIVASEGDAMTDDLRQSLADKQVKFAKHDLEALGYYPNQIPEKLEITSVTIEDQTVTFEYAAEVDLVRWKTSGTDNPTLDQLPTRDFTVRVPLNPLDVLDRAGESCAADWEPYVLEDYKYFYYFAPDRVTCTEPLWDATVEVVQVYPENTVYPEYDQLVLPMDDQGSVGFRAAILPNHEKQEFLNHKNRLERMGLSGTTMDGGKLTRYEWVQGEVKVVIDLYDPTEMGWFESYTNTFREALGDYQLVYYNGHSNYGTYPYFSYPEDYADHYQIFAVHSCYSYAYYSRQILNNKASDEDPKGFAKTDVVGTGLPSYAYDSPKVMENLLTHLVQSLVQVQSGNPAGASSWQTIIEEINDDAWRGIHYGAAGVRDNNWQPVE